MWQTVELGSLANFKNGLNFGKESWGRGLKIIGVSDFKDRLRPEYSKLEEINPKGVARDLDLLHENDIVFVRSNGNRQLIGRSLLVRNLLEPVSHSGFTIRLRFQSHQAFPLFYAYLFRSDLVRQVLSGTGGGTNINNLNQGLLSRLRVPVPPQSVQRRIAAILSAYDDLIENNRRRIALLEKMAEEIYREWFVRLRFPGHEQGKFEKGLPVGWVGKKFGEFCKLKRGYDLPDDQVVPGPFPVVAATAVKTFHNHFKAEPPVITTGRSGSLGDVLITYQRAWPLNTTLYVQDGYGNSAFLIYYTLKFMGLESFNAGAGVPTLNRNHLNGIPMNVPPRDIQRAFDEQIAPIHRQIESLKASIDLATRGRDALLPRLISGKLPVDALDIRFPSSMQLE